jgi:lipid II:glycine glycyltransferase (peptidoglycan interpeptide bridge formation enzyme)
LAAFCAQHEISRLTLNTFGAPADVVLPRLPGETSRLGRREFLLDLKTADLWPGLSSNHKRRVKAAEKAGVSVRAAEGTAAIREHARLIEETFSRRKDRGEEVPEPIDPAPLEALTASGAGRVYQACLADSILSSILVLRSEAAGYYQTAGNSPEGLSAGASHLLVYRVAQILQSESAELFNLGGVSEHNPGLVRFKESFGAKAAELETAEFDVGPAWKKAVTSMASLVRRGSASIRKLGSAKP